MAGCAGRLFCAAMILFAIVCRIGEASHPGPSFAVDFDLQEDPWGLQEEPSLCEEPPVCWPFEDDGHAGDDYIELLSRQPFLPAKAFAGHRQGYVFKTDTLGLGYYLDDGTCVCHAGSAGADCEPDMRDTSCFKYLSGLFSQDLGQAAVTISLEELLP